MKFTKEQRKQFYQLAYERICGDYNTFCCLAIRDSVYLICGLYISCGNENFLSLFPELLLFKPDNYRCEFIDTKGWFGEKTEQTKIERLDCIALCIAMCYD